ncbi:RNA exonuclease 1 homolog [Engraulis encrasicolus]|uniref:RNA exonuclease 1 homolog n=1 Tax=Engraulis encrasicolus TaxID=184585 RepID=UPI002FCF2652
MFPSTALLSEFNCPFYARGQCHRPFCKFHHVERAGSVSPRGYERHPTISTETPSTGNNNEVCLLELQKINEQIESAKCEVEEQQRKLSYYRTIGTEKKEQSLMSSSVSKSKNKTTANKKISNNKYVVGKSKPRTDLEYDPCSNFVSGLMSSGARPCKDSAPAKPEKENSRTSSKVSKNNQNVDDSEDEPLVIDVPSVEEEPQDNKQAEQTQTSTERALTESPQKLISKAQRCHDIAGNIVSQTKPQRIHVPPSRSEEESYTGNGRVPPKPPQSDVPPPKSEEGANIRRTEAQTKHLQLIEPPAEGVGGAADIGSARVHTKPMQISGPPHAKSVDPPIIGYGGEQTKPQQIHMPPAKGVQVNAAKTGSGKALQCFEKDQIKMVSPAPPVQHHQAQQRLTIGLPPDVGVAATAGEHSALTAQLDDDEKTDFFNVLESLCASFDEFENECATAGGIGLTVPIQKMNGNNPDAVCQGEDLELCSGYQELKVQIASLEMALGVSSESDKFATTSTMLQSRTQHIINPEGHLPLPIPKIASSLPPVTPAPPRSDQGVYGVPNAGWTSAQHVPNGMHVQVSKPVPRSVVTGRGSGVGVGAGQCLLRPQQHTDARLGSNPGGGQHCLLRPQQHTEARLGSNPGGEQQCLLRPQQHTDARLVSNPGGGQCLVRPQGNANAQARIPSGQHQFLMAQNPSVHSTIGAHNLVQQATLASYTQPAASVTIPKGMVGKNGEAIVISSESEDDELNYSDFDLSESDPMEECYRIFMEGKAEDEKNDSIVHNSPAVADETAEAAKIAEAGVKANMDGMEKGQRNRVAHKPKPEETVGAFQLPPNAHFILPQSHSAVPVIVPLLCPPQQPAAALPQPLLLTQPKPMPTKRKAKVKSEVEVKVPHNVRQRYVNMFVEEFLKTSTSVPEAFEKALIEEKSVYDRSINRLKYLSVAVNALKRLRNQSTTSSTDGDGTSVAIKESKGHISLKSSSLHGAGDPALYESLKEHVLSDEVLSKNNYPLQHPNQAGCAVQYGEVKKTLNDELKRICCRCGSTFNVNQAGKHTRTEECTYHHGRVVENKVPGGVETRYSCCEGAVGTAGCQVFKLHVHDTCSLSGFVSTRPTPSDVPCCPGMYAIDCEMCYTTQGLELIRVTVVNSSLQVIYDTFVKPESEVIDYNTRFSGISEKDVKGTSVSLKDVQKVLMTFISADTILIGHELDQDLCALKLLHSMVVDTCVSFPHRLGPPHKLELHNLTADYLRKIIQEGEDGRDTGENATACMQLMLWRVKEDAKVRKW